MLAGLTFDQYEAGTQAFVPGDQVIECGSQGVAVKLAGETQRYRNMVGQTGGGIELSKEPQSLLGERQWQRKIPINLLDGGPLLLLSLQLLFDFLF